MVCTARLEVVTDATGQGAGRGAEQGGAQGAGHGAEQGDERAGVQSGDKHGPGWRPQALRDGQEPDPRFTLANERTFLAWIRTSLGLVAGAVALEAFAGDDIPEIIRTPVACILLVLAAVLAVVSFRRWIRIEASLRHNEPLPVPQASILLVLGIAIGAVVLIVAILGGS